MVVVLMFLITVCSSVYGLICYKRSKIFEDGFVRLAKIAYNPQNKEDCIKIVEKLKDDLIRTQETDYRE